MGEEGFTADSSLLYHRGVPSAIVNSTTWDIPDVATTPNHPLKPRHLKLHELFPKDTWASTDIVTGRRLILANADVRLSYAVSTASASMIAVGGLRWYSSEESEVKPSSPMSSSR